MLSFIPLLCVTCSIFGQDPGKLPFNHGQRIPSTFESMADGIENLIPSGLLGPVNIGIIKTENSSNKLIIN